MRRLFPLLLVLLVVALMLPACGGEEDEGSEGRTGTSPAAVEEGRGEKEVTGASPARNDDAKEADGRGRRSASGASPGRVGAGGNSHRTDRPEGPTLKVDLKVRPGSIRGARVTSTGAVQTLPPDESARNTAQENSYSSIKQFGEEASGEEATDITFALVQYLTAKVEGDWPTACARLYDPLRERLERGADGAARSCPEVFGELMSRVPQASLAEQAKIDVSSVRRGGDDRAFVIYKTPDTLSADMPMYLKDGVWKVGALEAYVLTQSQIP